MDINIFQQYDIILPCIPLQSGNYVSNKPPTPPIDPSSSKDIDTLVIYSKY